MLNNYIFVDFLHTGYSHFFFNTAFIEEKTREDVIIEFYTYKKNYTKYHEYFKNNKKVEVKAYFLNYIFLGGFLNYLINGLIFFLTVKRKSKFIIVLSTDYTVLPFILYLFSVKNVNLILHQVRFATSKSFIRLMFWKILLKNKSYHFTLLSRAQLDFLSTNNLPIKSCLVNFHPFKSVK